MMDTKLSGSTAGGGGKTECEDNQGGYLKGLGNRNHNVSTEDPEDVVNEETSQQNS